jgi:predicted ATPase/class 3 adenylate cyclase
MREAVDIAAWLRELGLERYGPAFRENEIDWDVLPELTESDLEELGLPLGPRTKLLKAIAGLSAEATAVSLEAVPSPRRVSREAERRQLTVLFCDVVGSLELAARLDPEDLREVMVTYHRCAADVVERWGGHVAKYLGDGVVVYFGWPRAHEDDAERAVRVGLDLVEAVREVHAGNGLTLLARVGIATGAVVVGGLIGEGVAQEFTVVGDTPNLAARLRALAEPGSVIVSQATRRLVGGLFELADLGPQRLKGFAEPLPAWRVEGEGRAEGRFEALHGERLTPLVGRDPELALLLERWELAKEGEGRVVLLASEPGIGKSRLVRALRERLGGEPHAHLSYEGLPYHQTSPLHPVVEQLERAAGFVRADTTGAKLGKLEALLARSNAATAEAAPLLAALLSIPAGDRYSPLGLSPQRQKARTLEVLIEWIAGLAAQRPVLVVLEDAHWSDPTTVELFGLMIERVQRLPVLVVITFRPEFQPPWMGRRHVTLLTLNRLSRRDGATMVERVTGKMLPPDIVGQIVAKSDGVPLFVEELTKAVVESGLLREEADRYELAGPLSPLAIPPTLQDSLMARLDRLAPVKEVAQIGAVMGRDFSYELLAAVADRPEAELHSALDQLVSSELVFRRGVPPGTTYSFKHALVQDTAYQSLLKSRRQQLHTRIIQVLERFPATVATEPELLAHHCVQAGLMEQAVDYWIKAGQLSLARSATLEAVAQLSGGLKALRSLPESPEGYRRELDLQVALGRAQLAAKGWAAPETGEAYKRARVLCERLGETRQLFPVLWGLTVFHINRGEPSTGYAIAEEMLRLAKQQDDAAVRVASHRALSAALYHLGEFARTRAHLEQVLALCQVQLDRHPPSLYASDHRVMALSFLPPTLLILGYADQARARHREALAYAREVGQPHSLALALDHAFQFHCVAHEWKAAHIQAQALVELSTEQGFSHYRARGTLYRGCALAASGQTREGFALCDQAFAVWQDTGANVMTLILGVQAEAHWKASRPEEALHLLEEVLDRVERTSERWFEAELHRLKGEVLISISERDGAEAESSFQRAVQVARGQSAKMWELRATISLARLWQEQSRRAEGHDLLARIYGWFTEGFDTTDLKEAKALLDELA